MKRTMFGLVTTLSLVLSVSGSAMCVETLEATSIERERREPWYVDQSAALEQPLFYSLYYLARHPRWAGFFRRLGVKYRASTQHIVFPPIADLNRSLAEIGSPFKVAAVEDIIKFSPWLALFAGQGKFAVADAHDFNIHAAAILTLPPRVGWALQGKLALLSAARSFSPPPGLSHLISTKLGRFGEAFEQETFEIGIELSGTRLAQMVEGVSDSYARLLGVSEQLPRAGAAAELAVMVDEIRRNARALGFANPRAAQAYIENLSTWLRQRPSDGSEPRFSSEVNFNELAQLTHTWLKYLTQL
jgi:hypothetical protein